MASGSSATPLFNPIRVIYLQECSKSKGMDVEDCHVRTVTRPSLAHLSDFQAGKALESQVLAYCCSSDAATDGRLLAHVYWATLRSSEGSSLQLLVLGSEVANLEQVSCCLAEEGIPHFAVVGDLSDPVGLQQRMTAAGLTDLRSIVFIQSLEEQQVRAADVLGWSQFPSLHGIIVGPGSGPGNAPDCGDVQGELQLGSVTFEGADWRLRSLLEVASSQGFAPLPSSSKNNPRDECGRTMLHLVRGPCTFRLAKDTDVASLTLLQAFALPLFTKHFADGAEILELLNMLPDGQFVAELDGEVIAAVLMRRAPAEESVGGDTAWQVAMVAINPILQSHTAHVVTTLGEFIHHYVGQHGVIMPNLDKHINCQDFCHAVPTSAPETRQTPKTRGSTVSHDLLLKEDIIGLTSETIKMLPHSDRRRSIVAFEHERGSQITASIAEAEAGVEVASVQQTLLEITLDYFTAADISADQVSFSTPLMDAGLDSLDLLKLASLMSEALGSVLPSTILFDYPTIEELAKYLAAFEIASAVAEAATHSTSANTRHSLTTMERLDTTKRRSSIVAGGRNRRTSIFAHGVLSTKTLDGRGASIAVHPSQGVPTMQVIVIESDGLRFGNNDMQGETSMESFDRDCPAPIPLNRWDSERQQNITTRFAGFMDGVDEWDSAIFGVSAVEASLMDPQQRLVLESVYETVTNSSLSEMSTKKKNEGNGIGVFFGASYMEYAQLLSQAALQSTYSASGGSLSVISGRVSYLFGFSGPSVVTETACSSSLVSLSSAHNAILCGAAAAAVSGGVNLILHPGTMGNYSMAGMLTMDGRCKALDAAADGYVRAEAVGSLVIRPRDSLEASLKATAGALAKNVALLLGTAINQDGRSSSLTAPNGPAQSALINTALHTANLHASKVATLHLHGTGTALGDPIEVNAALSVLMKNRKVTDGPVVFSAVKSSAGHAEPAAGSVGLAASLSALKSASISRILHLRSINPHVNQCLGNVFKQFGAPPVHLPKSRAPLAGQPHHNINAACFSAFAFQGTNAHAVMATMQPGLSASAAGVPLLWVRHKHWFTSPGYQLSSVSLYQMVQCSSMAKLGVIQFVIDLCSPRLAHLREHQVKKQHVFPFAALLVACTASGVTLTERPDTYLSNALMLAPLTAHANGQAFAQLDFNINTGSAELKSYGSASHLKAYIGDHLPTGVNWWSSKGSQSQYGSKGKLKDFIQQKIQKLVATAANLIKFNTFQYGVFNAGLKTSITCIASNAVRHSGCDASCSLQSAVLTASPELHRSEAKTCIFVSASAFYQGCAEVKIDGTGSHCTAVPGTAGSVHWKPLENRLPVLMKDIYFK